MDSLDFTYKVYEGIWRIYNEKAFNFLDSCE